MNEERLQEIEARDKTRTQGKWESGRLSEDQAGDYVIWHERAGRKRKRRETLANVGYLAEPVLPPEADLVAFDTERKNATFIAACSEDIPDLLAEVRRLQAEVEALKATSCANSAASHKILTAAQPRARMGLERKDSYALGALPRIRT